MLIKSYPNLAESTLSYLAIEVSKYYGTTDIEYAVFVVSSDLLLGTSISYPSLNGIGKHISSPLDKQIYSVQKWANKHAKKLDEYAEILKNDAAWIYKDFDYVLKHGLLEDFGTSVALLMQYMNVMNYLYTIFQKEFQQG